jgi:DNA-binding MarR family transcriptional regulator
MWHVQKELFVLSQFYPKVQEFFKFEKHYQGPYSQVLQDLVVEPAYHVNAYTYDQHGYHLTPTGKKIFQQLVSQYADNEKFTQLLKASELIRRLYDKLTKDELLFLIYITYPAYTEFSDQYQRLVENKANRKKLAESLYKLGLVTEERYKELAGNVIA